MIDGYQLARMVETVREIAATFEKQIQDLTAALDKTNVRLDELTKAVERLAEEPEQPVAPEIPQHPLGHEPIWQGLYDRDERRVTHERCAVCGFERPYHEKKKRTFR